MKQNDFIVRVHKTDKIDISDKNAPLPPSRGLFDEYRVADHFCPDEWSKDGVFISVEEDQPLWFDFRGSPESACIPSVQRLNPLTGKPADLEEGMTKDPEQNYMVLPVQRWLDGYAKGGKVYQFVVTKEGVGLAVSEHVLPEHMQDSHAIGFAFFSPKNPKPVRSLGLDAAMGSSGGINPSDIHLISAGSSNYFNAEINGALDMGTKSKNIFRSTQNYSAEISCSVDQPTEGCFVAQAIDDNCVKSIDVTEEIREQDLDKAAMGMGGRIEQVIEADDNSVDYYKKERSGLLVIYFALPEMFKSIIDKGLRIKAKAKDKYTHSGEVGGVQVPLI